MKYISFALVTSGICLSVCSTSAPAQETGTPQRAGLGLEEVIVTARRRAEALEDVPQTVSVATGEQLENLNIEQMGDLERLVAGLQISGLNVSMRGLTFDPNAASSATVANYLNDAPVISAIMFRSIFDVGQIEVLRGPQGTLRGVASPSGSMTLTTHQPDLAEWGGQVSANANDRSEANYEAAVNVPIIEGVLAVRAAGLVDYDTEGARSLNNRSRPRLDTKGARVTVRFKPSDPIDASIMWQRLSIEGRDFGAALFGNGAVGGVNPNAPAGYNGPRLTPSDDRTVQAYPTITDTNTDQVTAHLDWTFAGQKVSYIGAWQDLTAPLYSIADTTNMLLGFPLVGNDFPGNGIKVWTHELRLSSEERIAGIFDYVAGVFRQKRDDTVDGTNGLVAFLPGAFGRPGTIANPGTSPNLRYSTAININFPVHTRETSLFGNITAHIGDKLEVSGGVRKISFDLDRTATLKTTPAFTAQALPGLPCSVIPSTPGVTGAAVVSPVYGAGVCDIPILEAVQVYLPQEIREDPWLWDAAISYHITSDLMVYGHAGTSWRQPYAGVGIANGTGNPQLNQFILGDSEESESYEVGAKWSFLEGRGYLFADYFHQKFDGLIYGVPGGARFLSGPTAVRSNPFFVNVPAEIDGVDVELGLRVTDRWNVSGNFSWSKGEISGVIPCTDGDFNGIPDGINAPPQAFISRGIAVALCPSNAGTSTAPDWNARVTSEYDFPLFDAAEGFVRGLVGYQPENDNASLTFTAPSYTLVDLFAGIRLPNKGWEISVYAKNVTDTDKILNQSAGFVAAPAGLEQTFGQTGYRTVSFTPRREVGVNVRFAFGSR